MDCVSFVCFVPLDPNGPRIFGFAEYLTALALIVVAWTIAERRYTFHLQTARWPVRHIAFYTVGAVGIVSLITDVWRASGWLVPAGSLITPAAWQGILGFTFLAAFTLWIYTAFLRPPRFDAKNAPRFIALTYHTIVTGDRADLGHLADALASSAKLIVQAAAKPQIKAADGVQPSMRAADEMLHIMADPIFCRSAVNSAPRTLYYLFDTLRTQRTAARSMGTLAKNVLDAAVNERQSFLHRETADWQEGLAAQIQSLTKCLYGDSRLLDDMPMVFWAMDAHQWTSCEWRAYLRAARQAFHSYAHQPGTTTSNTISDIFRTLESGTRLLNRVNGSSNPYSTADEISVTRAILEFLQDASISLESSPTSIKDWSELGTYHDPVQRLAKVYTHILFDAAHVTQPIDTSWSIQYSLTWNSIFSGHTENGETVMREVRERVARMVWNQIRHLEYAPNYVGARLLGICLNIGWVVGTGRGNSDRKSPDLALLRMVWRWTDRNFDWLYTYHPDMAKVGFSEVVTYLPGSRILRRKWEPNAFRPREQTTDRAVQRRPHGDPNDQLKPLSEFPDEIVSSRRRIPTSFH